MLRILLLVTSVPLFACATEPVDDRTTPPLFEEAGCGALVERRFVTVELQTDCGPAPAGSNITCRWSVDFRQAADDRAAFTAHVSDTGESGTASCTSDGTLVDEHGNLRGRYDAAEDRLTWGDVVYAPE